MKVNIVQSEVTEQSNRTQSQGSGKVSVSEFQNLPHNIGLSDTDSHVTFVRDATIANTGKHNGYKNEHRQCWAYVINCEQS